MFVITSGLALRTESDPRVFRDACALTTSRAHAIPSPRARQIVLGTFALVLTCLQTACARDLPEPPPPPPPLIDTPAVARIEAVQAPPPSPQSNDAPVAVAPPELEDAPHPLLGRPAPDISANGVMGGHVFLPSFRGQVVILAFFATWCEPCKYQLPELGKLPAAAGHHSVRVVAVSVDDDVTPVYPYVSSRNVRLPVIWDAGHRISNAYSPRTMPTTFIIDEQGIVRFVHDGYRPGEARALMDRIAKL